MRSVHEIAKKLNEKIAAKKEKQTTPLQSLQGVIKTLSNLDINTPTNLPLEDASLFFADPRIRGWKHLFDGQSIFGKDFHSVAHVKPGIMGRVDLGNGGSIDFGIGDVEVKGKHNLMAKLTYFQIDEVGTQRCIEFTRVDNRYFMYWFEQKRNGFGRNEYTYEITEDTLGSWYNDIPVLEQLNGKLDTKGKDADLVEDILFKPFARAIRGYQFEQLCAKPSSLLS